jgi:hypothetical protein
VGNLRDALRLRLRFEILERGSNLTPQREQRGDEERKGNDKQHSGAVFVPEAQERAQKRQYDQQLREYAADHGEFDREARDRIFPGTRVAPIIPSPSDLCDIDARNSTGLLDLGPTASDVSPWP